MDLKSYLQRHGLSTSHLVEVSESQLGLTGGDVLCAIGSLVEDLGNGRSDVDLLLITDRTNIATTYPSVAVLPLGSLYIDVYILDTSTAEALVGRLAVFAGASGDPRDAGEFGHGELKLLHRMIHAEILCGFRAYQRLVYSISIESLVRQRIQNALHECKCLALDLLGMESDEDWPSMTMASSLMLDYSVEALLAGHGLTNPVVKWRMKLLQRLPQDWSEVLPGIRYSTDAINTYIELRRHPQVLTGDKVVAHCLSVASYCRAILCWASWRMENNGLSPFSGVENAVAYGFNRHLDFGVFALPSQGGFVAFNVGNQAEIADLPAADIFRLFAGAAHRKNGLETDDRLLEIEERLGARRGPGIDEDRLANLLRPVES